MAEPQTGTAPPPAVSQTASLTAVSPGALRVVLFGLPAAGKSSLLGALAQAAQTQEHLLNGRLVPRSDGLAEQQRRVYVEQPRPTAEEVAPYPVEFEPFTHEGPAVGRAHVQAVLIDCDGRVANDLLARRRALGDNSPEGTLAREVVEADTLVLIVDAAAPPVQVDAEFAEFGRFLRLLQQDRGRRTEVGGLPVFLVLSKCDLLAQPNDTAVDWLERIEERKRQVHRRFQDFIARQGREGQALPFGGIDLHLWATAVKRPALGDTPAKPRDPYGVAELFRQCLEAAERYRQRQRHSNRRLLWTTGGAVGVLAAMAALAAGLYVSRGNDRQNPLANKVASYQGQEGETPSDYLRGDLARKIGILSDLKENADFASLPPEQQEYVNNRLAELQAYQTYQDRLQAVRPVRAAHSDADLREIQEALEQVQVPPPYQKEWEQTEAVQGRQRRLKDVTALRTAVAEVEEWYRTLRLDGEQLLRFAVGGRRAAAPGGDWAAWYARYQSLLARAADPRYREEDRIPGASPDLTYAVAYRFTRVVEARGAWDSVRERLDRVRDLAAALGLIGPLNDRPAVLVIPGAGFGVQDARDRVAELRRAYPRWKDVFTLGGLPDTLAGSLRSAARSNYEKLLPSGQAEVLRHLQAASPDGKETLEHWRELRPWLADPEELRAWRVLAEALGRLQSPDWTDPVSDLAAFLNRDQFEIDLKGLTLEIPLSLNARPAGKLSVYHPASSPQGPALAFTVGEPQLDSERRVQVYSLRLDGAPHALTYHPGDKLWADLPAGYGDSADWMLTWVRGRSEVYQFDHLRRAPQLHPKDQDVSRGEVAQGVYLNAREGSQLPAVPELMPVVKLEKQ
jgi:hypothetical protein